MCRQRSATSTENFFLNCRVRVPKSCRLWWEFQTEIKQFVTSEILTILHFDKLHQINNIRLACGGGRKGGWDATEGNRLCTVTSSHFCSHLHCQALFPLCQICSLLHDKATVVLQLKLLALPAFTMKPTNPTTPTQQSLLLPYESLSRLSRLVMSSSNTNSFLNKS